VRQRLGGNPTAPRPYRRGPPDMCPLPWRGGDQGQFPLDSYLVKKACKASSCLERRRRLVPHTRRQANSHEEASVAPPLAPMAETGRQPRPTWSPCREARYGLIGHQTVHRQ
jgi:hypothetical protein